MVEKISNEVKEAESQVTTLKKTLDETPDSEETKDQKEKIREMLAFAQKDVEDKQKEMIKLIAKKDEAFRMRTAAESQLDAIEKETKANEP